MLRRLFALTGWFGPRDTEIELSGFRARCSGRFGTVVTLCAPDDEPVILNGDREGNLVTYLISFDQREKLQMQGDYFLNLLIREAFLKAGITMQPRVLFEAKLLPTGTEDVAR